MAEKAIQEFKSALMSKFGSDVALIQLFGSRARGDARQDSDMDILVVLKEPQEDQISFIYDTAMRLSGEHGTYLSVKIFSKKEFEYYKSIPTMFISNVLREGIKLA